MKISKVIYLLFGGGTLAIVAILIVFYQPNLIEEKELVVPLVKEVVDAKPIEIKTTRKQSGETIKLEVIRVRPDGSLVIAGKGFPNSKIEIISGSKVIAKTTSDKVGEFIAVPEKELSRGEYLLSFRQINKDTEKKSLKLLLFSKPTLLKQLFFNLSNEKNNWKIARQISEFGEGSWG